MKTNCGKHNANDIICKGCKMKNLNDKDYYFKNKLNELIVFNNLNREQEINECLKWLQRIMIKNDVDVAKVLKIHDNIKKIIKESKIEVL